MSVQEIITELPRFGPDEVQLVREKCEELQSGGREEQSSWGKALEEFIGKADDLPEDLSVNHNKYALGGKASELEATSDEPKTSWGKAMLEIAGTVDDLPPDAARNLDHYLYGAPKRS